MKRLSLVTFGLLCAVVLFAQEGTQGLGLQIGFDQSVFRLNSPAELVESSTELGKLPLNGLKVGLVYEATYLKGFGNMIGLNYTYAGRSGKWEKLQENQIGELPVVRQRQNMHAMEVFVDWQYKFEIAGSTYVILYTGPTIQCSLSFDETDFYKYSENADDKRNTQIKISSFDYDDAYMNKDYTRWNVTWGVGAGFQYDRYYLRGGYDFGLVNPYKHDNFTGMGYKIDRNTRGRLDQWHIKLGVYLWQK